MSHHSVLFVLTPQFHPNTGGVQMTTYKLSKWLVAAGYKVGVFSFQKNGHVDQNFARLFTATEEGGPSNERNLGLLKAAVEKFEPEIVINQMPYDHRIGVVLRRLNPPLLLGCLRNTLFSVKNNLDSYASSVLPAWIAPLARTLFGRALLLRMHSARHKQDLKRILETYDYFVMFAPPNLAELRFFLPDFDETKIRLVPNSVPAVLDHPPAKAKRILWLGRVAIGQKRADLILPIWERVRAVLPDWELDVVGDGPALVDLKLETATRCIKGITFHGQQEPQEYFRSASVFVMTSSYEGFPNTLVEAQSFGAIPVVFNSYPVANWLIDDGVNGFLVPPFDVDKMVDRIVTVARGGEQTGLMNGALENARRFHIDNVGKRWQHLFRDCLEAKEADSAIKNAVES